MSKTQEHKEEMIKMNHLLEAKRSEMDAVSRQPMCLLSMLMLIPEREQERICSLGLGTHTHAFLKTQEVAALKRQSDDMEANLRKEIVEENLRLNQLIQQTNDENAKAQREWRQKQLDKEREHAAQVCTTRSFGRQCGI